MSKVITEVAIGAAAIGAAVFLPGVGIAISTALVGLIPGITTAGVVSSMVALGGSMVLSGLADALRGNQGGLAVAVTTPIGPWGYVYGTQKVGGVEIFRQSNNSQGTSNNKELHRVYLLAAHPCQIGAWQLRIDGRQVLLSDTGHIGSFDSVSPGQIHQNIATLSRDINGLVTMTLAVLMVGLDGTSIQITEAPDNNFNGIWIVTQPNPLDDTIFEFVCGGPVKSISGGQCWTLYADYKDKIHVEFLDGTHTSTFPGLLASGTSWGATDLCLGKTLVYVRMGYDETVFPSNIPNVSFVIDGKNDILDPRGGGRGFTKNAALCIADFLSMPATKGGFGLNIGTDIPNAPLSAAANICDEAVPLAAGGTVARYTLNTFFQLNATRGSMLQGMLTACAGRISYQGGQFSIHPAAWVGPTLQLTVADLVGPIKWNPRFSIRDTCNAVKGTYVSPENAYQQGDVPAYMQDYKHGYGLITDPGQGDQWLLEDGSERIFKEANFPCTDNCATAQRLAKIALMRTRNQGRGTLSCTMKAYQAVALDVIQLTHARYGWVNKDFEVLASRFTAKAGGVLGVELDIAETSSLGFDWATTEELSPQGYKQPYSVAAQVCQPPESVTLYSGPGETIGGVVYPSTVTTGADGRVSNSLLVEWVLPNDAYVLSGGHIELQWRQYNPGAPLPWLSAGKFDPSVTQKFLTPVTDALQYEAQVRAVNCIGVPSKWIYAGPETISSIYSVISYSGLPVAPPGTVTSQSLSPGTAQITILPFTPPWGPLCTPSPSVLTGENPSQLYYVYYIDPRFAGGLITPIATQVVADFENKAGYFLIGQTITPNYSPRYQPTSFSDIGTSSTINGAAAYDNNVATDAVVPANWGSIITGYTAMPAHLPIFGTVTAAGHCVWGGFPAVVTTAPTTLTVFAALDCSGLSGGTAVGTISVSIAGAVSGLAGLSATTGVLAYTMTIPTGTDLSTVTVSAAMSIVAGTPPGGGVALLQGFEIYIQ